MNAKETLKARLEVLANLDALIDELMVLFPDPNTDSVSQAACARIRCETSTLHETAMVRAREGQA
jgi:hypothetical protein